MGAKTVSCVVTNYNGEHYLPGMIEALEKTGFPFLEIIVSDDASTDGGRLLLRHRYPNVRVIASDINRGPAPTRNAGILAASGDYILLLDNDGYPFNDAVEPLLRTLEENPELVGAMPRVMLEGDHSMVHYDGARTHISGQMWLLNSHVTPDAAGTERHPIASMVGTAMFFRRESAVRIGGFEPAYYFYYEDHDFGSRMRILEGALSSCPEARIRHLGGTANLSFRVGARYPRRRIFLTPKNRWLFTLRTLEGKTLLKLLPLLIVHEIAQACFVVAKGWAEPAWTALCWNISHLAATLRQREEIQRRRIVPDLAILEDGPLPLHPGLLGDKPLLMKIKRGLDAVLNGWYGVVRRSLEKDAATFRPGVFAAPEAVARQRDARR